jgi:hypothetical protein
VATDTLHIVYSAPPATIAEDEFNRWYDAHLAEILVVPGFVSARRFRLDALSGAARELPFRYLSLYELDGDVAQIMRDLDDEAARMELPEWFPQIRFASWNCLRIGGAVELGDTLQLVFSRPPEGVSDGEFVAFYERHVAEILQVPGYASAARFRLRREVDTANEPLPHRFLALYELDAAPAEATGALAREVEAARIWFPAWFAGERRRPYLTSWIASAVGDRVAA